MLDLHMHTTFSDGACSPEELIGVVLEHGLKVIAITDHDNTQSYLPALEAAKDHDLELIPGIEINTSYEGHEVHVLGYFIDRENETLKEVCAAHNAAREEQMQQLVKLMHEHGKVHLSLSDIQSYSRPGGTIGRPHVARALVDKGAAGTISEAFDKFLVSSSPTYFKRRTVTPHEAVEAIYESGGIPVIAHPGDMPIIEDLTEELMNYGLRGLEAYHKSHRPAEIEFHCSLAERFGLIVTGGTDFHGRPENYANVRSRLHLPEWVLDQLREEKQRMDMSSVKAS